MPEPGVFLSAGEPSGDMHGAELARAIRRRNPEIRLCGLGGARMAEAGVELLAELDRLAVLGFSELVPRLADLARIRRRVRRRVGESIDLLVLIDYPGFNLPLARFGHRHGLPVVYYVAPQVWAWRSRRARQLAAHTDLVCTVLPFEAPLLERFGVTTRFVGHPLLDHPPAPSARAPGDPSVLGLFPGSRRQEVRRMLPVFLSAARALQREVPELTIGIARSPHLPGELFRGCAPGELRAPESLLTEADVAITKAGTITLQLALARVPMVVAYCMGELNYRVVRRLVQVKHISLVNLVAGRPVVRELVQQDVRTESLASEARRLLRDPDARERMVRELQGVESLLGTPGAAERVAIECLRMLGRVS